MSGEKASETISKLIELDDIPQGGADYVLEPNEQQRAAIAKRLGIPAVDQLRGAFAVKRVSGGAELKLQLTAETGRICVASLEPMKEEIEETVLMRFERNFVEDEDGADDDIIREPLESEAIDLGEILVQHLSLALDPYPRKSGAESLADRFSENAAASPFAKLKDLKGLDS